MTDYDKLEEQRQMARSNYYAQLAMIGYDSGGNPFDMVYVVRCKDCKFGILTKNGLGDDIVICENPDSPAVEQIAITPDWFCANGERRDEDAAD